MTVQKHIRLSKDVVKLVEDYRRGQTPIPSFNQAVNQLLKFNSNGNNIHNAKDFLTKTFAMLVTWISLAQQAGVKQEDLQRFIELANILHDFLNDLEVQE